MKKIIEFPTKDGSTVFFEVDLTEPQDSGMERIGISPDEIIEKANETFESALETVKPVADGLITKLKSIAELPAEIEIEFGLKMSAEAGVIISSVSTEANFKICITWKNT